MQLTYIATSWADAVSHITQAALRANVVKLDGLYYITITYGELTA